MKYIITESNLGKDTIIDFRDFVETIDDL